MDEHLRALVVEQPYPLLFATISGAHLYGFPSPDSDYDLRGVHLLPTADIVGLKRPTETVAAATERGGRQIDLVTHDIGKFCRLLLKKNGYVLEQLTSPLVIHTTPAHAELLAVARTCITRLHSHHYLGFAATQWRLFERENPPRIKPLLYVYRVLLTGIHLMRTGEVDANLVRLNEVYRLPQAPDLIARKVAGPEYGTLPDHDLAFHQAEYARLRAALEEAAARSHLPEAPVGGDAVNDLLGRLRLAPPDRATGRGRSAELR